MGEEYRSVYLDGLKDIRRRVETRLLNWLAENKDTEARNELCSLLTEIDRAIIRERENLDRRINGKS
jgi:hypothetical protein